MTIKLKRTSRTPYSEEIAIYMNDSRHLDGEEVEIGKLDVHYLEDQLVGTLLIWQEHATAFSQSGYEISLDEVINTVLSEISDPIGVPSEYGIEVYYPSLAKQDFFSNYADEQQQDNRAGYEPETASGEEEALSNYEGPLEDDFTKQLRSRPDNQ